MSDIWGPAPLESIGKWKYYISFTDDAKRYATVLFFRSKDGTYDRITGHALKLKQKFGKFPKWMCFNNRKELVNEKLKKWAEEREIDIQATAPY